MDQSPATSMEQRRPTLRQVETDAELLGRLRGGDERAFVVLVERYQIPMLRLARSMAPSQAVAEEAVQDAWVGVVRGIDRFEGRSSFKTWLFTILVNRARSAGADEGKRRRDRAPSVDPARFDASGQWAEPVEQWDEEVEERLDASAAVPVLRRALNALPDRQRHVVLLPRRGGAVQRGGMCSARDPSGQPANPLTPGTCRNARAVGRGNEAAVSMLSLRPRPLVCQQAIELLTEYLEGTLSRRQRRRLEAHLGACPNCSAYLEQIRVTIRITGTIEPEALSPQAVDELTELYRRWRGET